MLWGTLTISLNWKFAYTWSPQTFLTSFWISSSSSFSQKTFLNSCPKEKIHFFQKNCIFWRQIFPTLRILIFGSLLRKKFRHPPLGVLENGQVLYLIILPGTSLIFSGTIKHSIFETSCKLVPKFAVRWLKAIFQASIFSKKINQFCLIR